MADEISAVLSELRELLGPYPQLCIDFRDCGKETRTIRGTTKEYSIQVGANGQDFTGDTLSDVMKQVRRWHKRNQ